MRLKLNQEAKTVVFFSFLQIVLGFAANRAVTEIVAPKPLGELYLYNNLSLWLALPATSAYVYIWRQWPQAKVTGDARRLARAIGRGLTLQAVLCGLGAMALYALGLGVPSIVAAVLLFVMSSAQASTQALDQIQALERRRVMAGILGLMGNPAKQAILAVGGLLVIQHGTSLLGVQTVHSLLAVTASILVFRHLCAGLPPLPAATDSKPKFLSASKFAAYSVPYFVTTGALYASTSAERWGLAVHADTAATALFVQSVGLATAGVAAATSALSTYFSPKVAQAAANDENPARAAWPAIRRYTLFLSSVCVLGVTCAAVFAPWITGLFFGRSYAAVAPLLPWTVLGASLFAIGQTLSHVPQVAEDTISPNVAALVSRSSYVVALLCWPPEVSSAHTYARLYAAGNALYAVLMAFVAYRLVRRAHAPVALPEAAAARPSS